jgi:signal transduction histidine kinase
MTVTLLLWQALRIQERERIQQTIGAVADNVKNEISTRMDTRIVALVRIAQRWAYTGAPTQAQWELEAELNLHQFPGYEAIFWLDPTFQARWLISRVSTETSQSIGAELAQQAASALHAVEKQKTVIVIPAINFASASKIFLVCVPLMPGEISEGFIVGVFVFEELLNSILKNIALGYGIALFDGTEEVYRRDPSDGRTAAAWGQETLVDPYGVTWRVRVWPLPAELATRHSALPEVTLGVGVIMSLFLYWAVALARTARAQAQAVESTNQELNQEIAARQQLTEELEEARAVLERRVQERTAELARANEELRGEVSERQRAEAALARQAQELARSNSELEQFAYVASHDLQEPLRKILAFGDRLKIKHGQSLNEQGYDYVERMQAAATRMQALITDLLALSRVTTRTQPFAPVDLTEITRTIVSDMEVRIQQLNGQVHIGQLPTIEADPMQMGQLFQNLIGNALKFHRVEEAPVVKVWGRIVQPEGKVQQKDGSNQPFCQIMVEDNGIGFEEKYLDRIFEPFQRLHERGRYEGTGMGLAICRKIVERHGGVITARSTLGQGAVFLVTLPVRRYDQRHSS